jgi:phage portal protein BeeE
MTWITWLFGDKAPDFCAPAAETRDVDRYSSIPWGDAGSGLEAFYNSALGGLMSKAGTYVNPESAMRASAVYAAVRLLAETIGTLPLEMFEIKPDGSKAKALDHPLYNILVRLPNEENTAGEVKEAIVAHLNLRGNAFLLVVRNGAGEIQELIPLHPDRVLKFRYNGKVFYQYIDSDGQTWIFNNSEVMHTRGLCLGDYNGDRRGGLSGQFTRDLPMGVSPLTYAREAVGLALATEEYGARFFSNNARPGGVLETDKTLTPEAKKRLRESWESMNQGLANAHRVAVLEDGVKWAQLGMTAQDAQYLETRKFQAEEIARIFRVPPHMLALLDRATFNNIEHLGQEFVSYSLSPWITRIEEAGFRDLLTPAERKRYFFRFDVSLLLRGNAIDRANYYNEGRQGGWLCADECREGEGLNPLPDGKGKIYLSPLNMVKAGQEGRQQKGKENESGNPDNA